MEVSSELVSLMAQGYQFLEDPEAAFRIPPKFSGPRVDVFTFIQRLSETSTKLNLYPMEWDNMAALRVSTFDDWMTKQIDSKVRNMVRKATKSGVVVREVAFDDNICSGDTHHLQRVSDPSGKTVLALWEGS